MKQPKEDAKAVLFINWTDEDFSWKFDGDDYLVKARTSTYFKKFVAELFAKHLVDRELNKLKLATNDPQREEMTKRCFGEEISAKSENQVENEALNLNKGMPSDEAEESETFEGMPKEDETNESKPSDAGEERRQA